MLGAARRCARSDMKCPFCGNADTQVVETRVSEEGDFIRRRRQCAHCEKRFTTYERPEVSFPAVVKKDGRRIEYERAKLLASLNLALRKRPVSTEQIDSARFKEASSLARSYSMRRPSFLTTAGKLTSGRS